MIAKDNSVSKLCLAAAVLSALVAGHAVSQSGRPVSTRASYRFTAETHQGVGFIGSQNDGSILYLPLSGPEYSLLPPFDHHGGSASALTDHDFLVCGTTRYGTGDMSAQLSVLTANAGGFFVSELEDIPARDFLGCGYSQAQGRIYVLDGDSNEVLWAPWSGLGSPIPGAAAFQVAANATQAPVLRSRFVGIQTTPDGFLVFDTLRKAGSSFASNGSEWTITPYDPRTSATPSPSWCVQRPSSIHATQAFDVKLEHQSAPVAFDLVSMLPEPDVVLGSHTHPGGDASVSLQAPTDFYKLPGAPYALRGAGLRDLVLRPQLRFGEPGTLGEGSLALHRDLIVPAHKLFVGSMLFGYHAQIDLGSIAATDVDVTVYGLLGFRTEAGGVVVDPVVPLPGTSMFTIESPITVSSEITIKAGERTAYARFALPIATSEDLENVVLLFQIVAAGPNNELALSTVLGSSILDGAGSETAAMQSAAFPTAAQLGEARKTPRVQRCCDLLFSTSALQQSTQHAATLAERVQQLLED